MCFTITQKSKPKVRTAKNDIVCYKILTRGSLASPYQQTLYSIKKTETAKNNRGNPIRKINLLPPYHHWSEYRWTVIEGLHSYRTIKIANYYQEDYEVIVKCIIPKGTQYLVNEEEYVSLKLKPLEIVKV